MVSPKGYDPGCWIILTKHFGDAVMPLSLQANNNVMVLFGVIYGILVLIIPPYCLLAFWLMGVPIVKNRECIEGPNARRNFEHGIKALFKVPKTDILKCEKQEKQRKTASVRKTKRAERD
jgi:hypothetical protein